MTSFNLDRDPITDLALPAELQERLTDAMDILDLGITICSEVEKEISAKVDSLGWDGDWSAGDVVTEILERHMLLAVAPARSDTGRIVEIR